MSNPNLNRFQKQIKLEGFGLPAQAKLLNAKVLIIGAGGLGCPAITYLAAAGIGTLGIIDHDLIEETNLHRQPIYTSEDIGKPKVSVSADRAQKINPEALIKTLQTQISPANALYIIKDFDLVLDCTDNYEARYLINDACVLLDKPWIYGAVEAWAGQVSVFNFTMQDGSKTPTYRCIFPEPTLDAISCNDIGVIGTMPGTVGIMQANEAIKLITGIGKIQDGLLLVDLLTNNFQRIKLNRDENAIASIFALKSNYNPFMEEKLPDEISLKNILNNPDKYFIIDIREEDELDRDPFTHANLHMPMDELITNGFDFNSNNQYVLACAKGNRSYALLKKMRKDYPGIQFLSLAGGVLSKQNT